METYSFEFPPQNEIFKLIFTKNWATSLKSRMQKNRIEKIFIFQRDIFTIQSGKTIIGLHGEGGKLNLSDKEGLQ